MTPPDPTCWPLVGLAAVFAWTFLACLMREMAK